MLAGHPQISPCVVKEPGFLYPKGFPTRGLQLIAFEEGLPRYLGLFGTRPGLRMEATANYLYAPGVPERINDLFPGARVILILRNPVDRLISEFGFAKLMRAFPHEMTFSEYLAVQRAQDHDDTWREPHLRALSNGLYSRHLERFLATLGRQRVHVTWTDELNRDPGGTLRGICSFLGIPSDRFDTVRPVVSNRARRISRPWLHGLGFQLSAWRAGRIVSHRRDWATRAAGRAVGFLMRASTTNADPVALATDERRLLEAFYHEEPRRLREMLGQPVPWNRGGPQP